MFTKEFLDQTVESLLKISTADIEYIVGLLIRIRKTGRLFIIGSGGGAGHASHAVCDFRKLCGIDALTFENTSELTARVNDEGWETSYLNWLKASNFNSKDGLMVISVGGGRDGVSLNLINCLNYAKSIDSLIIGIVGRDGGLTKDIADCTILIPTNDNVTPITEGIQSVIWHLLVSHPSLQINKTVW